MSYTNMIVSRLTADDPLLAVIAQRSAAYGSVAGALDDLGGYLQRGQESEPQGRQARNALVAAIHAPRAEAELIADELTRRLRNVL